MEPMYISDDHKEQLDSDSYRITQEAATLDKVKQNGLQLYLSALSPADIADFYWSDAPVHDEDAVVATVEDFTDKEGGSGPLYCVVKRSEAS